MNYPNPKKKLSVSKEPLAKDKAVNYSNRGGDLEYDINQTNQYYLNNDLAVIHKKPTPVTVVKVDYPKRSAATITEAYYKLPSTTDYNGIYRGKYIDFEVKQSHGKTSLPFPCIHPHQIKHLDQVTRHGAIAFLIIRINEDDKDYLIKASDFLLYYNSTTRKSLPYSWIRENGFKIQRSYIKPCDYLKIVDEVFFSGGIND